MVYLTHYAEYPIYYPEEGGFYTAGNYVEEYYRLNSEKQAKRKQPPKRLLPTAQSANKKNKAYHQK